ncbi:25422_t:CDS:2 [Gigaspora rosea]|nr:25422_t:CDS:2 [Gigaspora rosea]
MADRISKIKQKSLELEFARSKQARPAFRLPSQKKLSTSLFDNIYNETKKEIKGLINHSNHLYLVSDGWSNLVYEHWTNYILTTPKPVFYAAHPTNETRQTSEAIANDLEKIIIEVGLLKISAIITDNTSAMKKLALKPTITELAHDNHTEIPNTISYTINSEDFWKKIEFLITVLDKLVAGIAIFESDTPKLALFYNWYHEQLESDEDISTCNVSGTSVRSTTLWKKLPANSMSTISAFIQKYYPNKADIIWRQLLQYKTRTSVFNLKLAWSAVYKIDLIAWWEGNFKESSLELYEVASRVLNILTSNYKLLCPRLESSDITKAVIRFNNRPDNQNNNFELLDPDSDDNESSEDDLIESNNESKSIESSESETELETEDDIDSENE